MTGVKLTVMAIGAHPDDLEMQCGGTISKYVDEGHKVFMLHVTCGDKGHKTIPPAEVGRTRKKEAISAAKILGAKPMFLNVPDAEVFYDLETEKKFVEAIRQANPDIILTHDPGDYHADHVNISTLVTSASLKASVAYYKTNSPATERQCRIFFFETFCGMNFQPEFYVDITKEFTKKLEALKSHKSQVEFLSAWAGTDVIDLMTTTAKFRGFQAGVKYAEAFKQVKVSLMVKPIERFP